MTELTKHASAKTENVEGAKNLPNFLLAGVAKGGTTSLHAYLRQHPEIFMSRIKEPSYFVHGYGMKKWEDYVALFNDADGKKAIGEASAIYASCEESAGWIKSVLGSVKIILVLRNPAFRAFSLYVWMVREGYEDAPTFAEALEREPMRIEDPNFRAQCRQFFGDYLYFNSGLYFEQVRRCFETFGRDRVKVYLFEEFIEQPVTVCQDIFRFLEVDPGFMPETEIHNEGRVPKSIAWQFWLRGESRRRRVLGSRSLRSKLAKHLMDWNVYQGNKPKADEHVLEALTSRYRPNIERLQELLGRDLSGWLTPKANVSSLKSFMK